MFLNGAQIQQSISCEKKDDLCNSALEKSPHYNLKIKCIIINNKMLDDKNCFATIKPQQVACVITERVALDEDILGFLYQKQQNYCDGLWIIEPDIIHPGYKGHLRVHVVNMSKIDRSLFIGDKILELLLYKNEKKFNPFPHDEINYESYVKKCLKEESVYAGTFMNLDGHAKNIAKIMFPTWVQIVAAMIGILLFLPGALSVYSYFKIDTLVGDMVSTEKIDVAAEIEGLKKQLDNIKNTLEKASK